MVLLRLQDRDPAASSVDEAVAAARRPYAGCEATRCVKPVRPPSDDDSSSSPLAADPAFEFTETPVVVLVAPQPRKAAASTTTVPLVMSPSSGQPFNTTQQLPRTSMAFEPLKLDGSDFPTPPRSPVAFAAPNADAPMSPLFGRKVVIAATSTLGRLEPPPPLVLPPPPAFDRLRGPASPQLPPPLQLAQQQQLPLQQQVPPPPPQQQQQQQQQRVSLVTMLTEDVALTFGSSGAVQVALEGHVQLGFVTAPPPVAVPGADAPPLEFDVALADHAGQVAAAKPNAAVLSLAVPTTSDKHGQEDEDDQLFGPPIIPEANSAPAPAPTPAATTDPASSSSYRCRIPRDRLAAPLTLLRYEAKPAVRPVPVRIQQCLVRVEGNLAHVVAQLAVNPNLFMPLAAASLAVQLLVPGLELEFGQALLAASPATGVSYAPPLLQWTLPEELKPGTTLLFKASVSVTNPTSVCPSSSWPVRALFKAQSRAGLTKVGVQYQHIQPQQLQQQPPAYDLDVQAPKRRFRVTARFEP